MLDSGAGAGVDDQALLDLFIYLLLNFAATFFLSMKNLLVSWFFEYVSVCVCVFNVVIKRPNNVCECVWVSLFHFFFASWSVCAGAEQCACQLQRFSFFCCILSDRRCWSSLLSSSFSIFGDNTHSLTHLLTLSTLHWQQQHNDYAVHQNPLQRVDKEKTQRKCCCKRSACGIYSGSVEL